MENLCISIMLVLWNDSGLKVEFLEICKKYDLMISFLVFGMSRAWCYHHSLESTEYVRKIDSFLEKVASWLYLGPFWPLFRSVGSIAKICLNLEIARMTPPCQQS